MNALGKLAPLYTDETVMEIIVDAPDKVFVERRGKLVDAGIVFDSADEIRAIVDAVLALRGITLGAGQTSGRVYFDDGSRFVAVIPPTARHSAHIALRKPFIGSMTMDDLFRYGSLIPAQHEILRAAIASRKNILVSGGTASGKTTIANMLTDDFPADERVIVVEQRPEYQPRMQNFIRFAAENSPDHSFADLVSLAEQMRPDRLVIGELRDGDALHVLNLFNTGHDGSMALIHANSVEDALARLETMCLMANLGLGLNEIRQIIASSIQLITHQERIPNGKRRLTHVTELLGLENGRYRLQPLFQYDLDSDTITPTGAKPSWGKIFGEMKEPSP